MFKIQFKIIKHKIEMKVILSWLNLNVKLMNKNIADVAENRGKFNYIIRYNSY